MVRVITIEREYGSQGAEFAHRLADRLHWKLIDRCLIDEIAHKAGVPKSMAEQCDERLDPWYYRMGKSFWHGSVDRLPAPPKDQVFDSERMVEFVRNYLKLRDCWPRRRLRIGQPTGSLQHLRLRVAHQEDSLV
jgi:hypothetical protein